MSEPSLELQAAIVKALRGNTDAGEAIYDKVMPGVFPRVSIGSGQVLSDDPDCVHAYEVYFQIDVWSNATGYPQAKQISGQIWKLLHKKDLSVSGFNLIDLRVQSADYSRDEITNVSRGRMQLKAYMEDY